MWMTLARGILKLRLIWLSILILITIGMGYLGSQIQLSYQVARVLPLSDSTQQHYESFKQRFGIDGSVMIVGFQDKRWFDLPVYQSWYDLTDQVRHLSGVKDVLSTGRLYTIARKDTAWGINQIVTQRPGTQQEVDSLEKKVLDLPFYEGLLVNADTKSTLMAISLDEKKLNTKDRLSIVATIRRYGEAFAKKNNITMHYSGLPSIRTDVMKRLSDETKLFMGLAVFVTGLLVWVLFRSWKVVVLSLIVVLMGVSVALGTLVALGYNITLLTGLVPPLLIVIGVPNCVFLVNKYNAELAEHGDKQLALINAIREIGLASLLANITTAIGFGVFYFTDSRLLMEFGIVASISIMAVYIICLFMVPIILSYLPVPNVTTQQTNQAGRWQGILTLIDSWVHQKRPLIYGLIITITLISAFGLTLIRIEGYVVDDLPKNDPVYTDMRFFEAQFKGALPFEVMIDTGKPNGIFAGTGQALYKIRAMERIIAQYPEFSKPRSLVDAIRFAYQSYRGGAPKYYVLPPALALRDMVSEAPLGTKSSSLARAYIDSTNRVARVSYQMVDIGSIKLKAVLDKLQPRIDSLFRDTGYEVSLTGHSLVFLKSNDYLLGNLYESLGLAILLIALVGMVLFRSVPIILLSKLPCLIPLLVTAGIMGYANIAFKPSTILIFSIAFGLSSDGTVYFLTSYRQQLQKGLAPTAAITAAIFETGVSLIYTALILAGGFSVFAASGFGGTAALGVLVATTVLMACLTNLILLPALLLTVKRYRL